MLQSLSRGHSVFRHCRLAMQPEVYSELSCHIGFPGRFITTLTCTRRFSADDVSQFMAVTGDINPIHLSAEAATQAGLPGSILPGMLSASLFAAIISRNFPGALYLSQTLKFRAPAHVGEPLIASVTLEKATGSRMKFNTICSVDNGAGQKRRVVVEGTALALIPHLSNVTAK